MTTRRFSHCWIVGALCLATACEQIEISVVEVASVAIEPVDETIFVNTTRQYIGYARSAGGAPLADRQVAWSIVNENIAQIDAAGMARGVAPGTTQVRATSEGVTGSTNVFVVARPVVLVASPTSLDFTATQGGASPAPRTVGIGEVNGTTVSGLSAAVAYPTGQVSGWVSASLSSSSTPATLSVGINGALPAGTFSAMLQVSAPGATNTPLLIPIQLVVQPAPSIRPSAARSGAPGGARVPRG